MPLRDTYEKLLFSPNGRQVALRLLQLTDFGLEPDNEYLCLSVQTVIRAIEEREESLLGRTKREIVRDGRLIKLFHQALKDSTQEEWEQFRKEIEIPPFEEEGIGRLFSDASGLVRGTHFEDWVLGKEKKLPIDPETILEKATLLGGKKEN